MRILYKLFKFNPHVQGLSFYSLSSYKESMVLYEHHRLTPVETKLAIDMPPVSIRCAHTTLVNPGRNPNGLSFSTVMAIVPLYHRTAERQSYVLGFCGNDLTSSSGIFGSESLICQKFKKTISHKAFYLQLLF